MKRFLVLLVTLGIVAGCAPTPKLQLGGIGDTSWQLVKYQGGNGAVQTPDDKTKYTLDEAVCSQARARVNDLLNSFPVYPEIDLPFLMIGLGMTST